MYGSIFNNSRGFFYPAIIQGEKLRNYGHPQVLSAMLSFLLSIFVYIASSQQPPRYGPWGKSGCTHRSVYVGGYVTGFSQYAVLAYPTKAIENGTTLPFLTFAHGMTAGGYVTYSDYSILWDVVCSYGYIILGPQSCPDVYCQNWYKDVEHTITTAKEKKGQIDPVLNYADFSKIGLYGHSMVNTCTSACHLCTYSTYIQGGAATVHVSDYGPSLGVVASVALHPAVVDDFDKQESADVAIPMLWFTGSADVVVPPGGVWRGFDADKTEPKICAEIKGATHFNCNAIGDNTEDAYVAKYFDCWIKGYEEACSYFYGNHANNLCKGGLAMTRCEIVGNMSSIHKK